MSATPKNLLRTRLENLEDRTALSGSSLSVAGDVFRMESPPTLKAELNATMRIDAAAIEKDTVAARDTRALVAVSQSADALRVDQSIAATRFDQSAFTQSALDVYGISLDRASRAPEVALI